MRYGDVFKGIGTFLGFLNGVGQPVGGILHHGKLDGQLLYLLKMVSGLIQGLGGVIKTIGQGQRLRFMLDQGNFRTHDASGLDFYPVVYGHRGAYLLDIVDAQLNICLLEGRISLPEGAVDL